MKKLSTILIVAALTLFFTAVLSQQAQANDNRHVMVEIFTSTTCPPCLPAAVGFDNWLSNFEHADRVSVIKYPVWWPGSGCIFYHQNPTPVNPRVSFYGANAAPTGVVDGTPLGSTWTSWRNAIQNRVSVAAPMDMSMVAVLNNGSVDVTVNMTRLPGADWPAQGLSLRLAIVERNIAYNGPNGSTNQDFVHRDMINGAVGVPVELTAGQTVTVSYNHDLNESWDTDNLKVVAFVQPTTNSPSRAVLQSAMVPVLSELVVGVPTLMEPANDAENVSFTDLSFSWSAASAATTYDIQVSASQDFQNNAVEFDGLSGTSVVVSELVPETTYFWRVRGINSNEGLVGDWSSVSSFTTIMAAPATEPTLLQPSNGTEVTSQFITLQWAAVESAASYDVEVAENSAFSNPVVSRTGITQLNTTISGLEEATTYYWRVRGVNIGGSGVWSEAFTFSTPTPTSTGPETDLPRVISLNQNYPNPFNPVTNISFELPETAEINLSVFTLEGRRVAVLADGTYSAGTHTLSFDAAALSSGTYIYRLETAGQSFTRLMTLVK
ncbi:Por secretion system C-terminal sorting domain-containing protein [Cyclonatronum proteinivorum]|uniref:Por secretion system C-terminal sorting domain-containing protein n=1 Tax=Cyclonatronum proteinivorum TaxID=1457365 RepID=A0A345UP26_9BACT|nr:Omp28-related outer membrane protein [Cyclonatronum proteinivorum]AXJ02228.1 Por secretion system C-terminal sorting domain-containing protein [Cyclonatronum proteinivorum]